MYIYICWINMQEKQRFFWGWNSLTLVLLFVQNSSSLGNVQQFITIHTTVVGRIDVVVFAAQADLDRREQAGKWVQPRKPTYFRYLPCTGCAWAVAQRCTQYAAISSIRGYTRYAYAHFARRQLRTSGFSGGMMFVRLYASGKQRFLQRPVCVLSCCWRAQICSCFWGPQICGFDQLNLTTIHGWVLDTVYHIR